MKRAIVVGSGAGGATAARELQGNFDVTILDAGGDFKPFIWNLKHLEKLRHSYLFFNARMIHWFFPSMHIRITREGMILVRGMGVGGTTTICTGNALRMDQKLKYMGIDLDKEFEELNQEIPVSTAHKGGWNELTQRLFDLFDDMGMSPNITPKMGEYHRCQHCGRCVFGCPFGVKWDTRVFIKKACTLGARMITHFCVEKVVIENGKVAGVEGYSKKNTQKINMTGIIKRKSTIFIPADVVILAAGGFGSPVILKNSAIDCTPRLFVDPVLCVAAEWSGAFQNHQVAMPFVVQGDNYIISPYFDYLSFYFNRNWLHPSSNILSLMIKLADTPKGEIRKKSIEKSLTPIDWTRLNHAQELCRKIMGRLGIKQKDIFLGTLNAGHPGGMLPLTKGDARNLHPSSLPENLYLADSTLFPDSLGNPPILTIMALAKKICRKIIASQ